MGGGGGMVRAESLSEPRAKKNSLPMPGIENHLLHQPARSPVAVSTELSGLPLKLPSLKYFCDPRHAIKLALLRILQSLTAVRLQQKTKSWQVQEGKIDAYQKQEQRHTGLLASIFGIRPRPR